MALIRACKFKTDFSNKDPRISCSYAFLSKKRKYTFGIDCAILQVGLIQPKLLPGGKYELDDDDFALQPCEKHMRKWYSS
jgi:hypothetical protein